MTHRLILFCAFIINAALAQMPGETKQGMLLPNGWTLTPAGTQYVLGDFPMNAVLSPDGNWMVVSHSGQSKAELRLIDMATGKSVQNIRMKDTWYGLQFQDSLLIVSGGYQDALHSFRLSNGQLVDHDSVALEAPLPKGGGGMSGVAAQGSLWVCLLRQDSTIRVYDRSLRSWTRTKLDGMPYDCKFFDQGKLLVSLWSSKKVVLLAPDASSQWRKHAEYTTGDHPNEITISRNRKRAYVACANDNTVSVIDLKAGKSIASIGTAIHPDAPEGSTTNSIAEVPGTSLILAANADNNSLTVIDVRTPSKPVPVGFIPVGWYPTKVLMHRKDIVVLNGKGGRSLANPKRQYIGSLFPGSMSVVPFPSDKQLLRHSKQVFANTPYKKAQLKAADFKGKSPIPKRVGAQSPIKHVFYIIKENRTYDQVFGDMPEGNGDTSLCLFGEGVTPNHHALAREFVLFDNFYVNSEVSADGHNWSVAAYATDFIEKSWPGDYGGRGGAYVYEGDEPTGRPSAGYLWTQCLKRGVTFRSYGEFITANDSVGGPGTPRDPTLEGHHAPYYRGWDMEYSDIDRYKAWEAEFSEYERNGKLPRLNVFHLPNDHTQGTKKGSLTPKAYVAQNDYALGLIVQRISRSPYWGTSAIFVVEDDAQNGPDHVDAHRSPALVVSPYTRKGAVDNTLYSTASMLRTMELILGLPPMSQYDAAAPPMVAAFMVKPDLRPYQAREAIHDLNERNPSGSVGELLMEEFDLSKEDRIPDRAFNEIIWESIKGSPMPAPRYTIFSRLAGGEEDEDERE